MRIGTMKILWSLNSFIACVRTPNHIVRASADGSRTQCESIRNWTHLALHNNYNWCDNFALCETRKKVNRMVPSLPPPHLSFHSARSAWGMAGSKTPYVQLFLASFWLFAFKTIFICQSGDLCHGGVRWAWMWIIAKRWSAATSV